MPPVDTGNFTLNVVAPVVEHTVTATFPSGVGASFDCALSEGIADLTFNDTGYEESYSYEVLAPGGAIETVQSSCLDFQESFQSPAGLANPRSGQPVRWVDGIGFYYPEDYATREVAIEDSGDRGDLRLLYDNRFVDSSITISADSDPTEWLVAANDPLLPQNGSMKATENTGILGYRPNTTGDIGGVTRVTAMNPTVVKPAYLKVVVKVEHSQGLPGGYYYFGARRLYDPGDPQDFWYGVEGRVGESVLLTAVPFAYWGVKFWRVDGRKIDDDNTEDHPDYVTLSPQNRRQITISMAPQEGDSSSPKRTAEIFFVPPMAYVVGGTGGPFNPVDDIAADVATKIRAISVKSGLIPYGGDRLHLDANEDEEQLMYNFASPVDTESDFYRRRIQIFYAVAHGGAVGSDPGLKFREFGIGADWLMRSEVQAAGLSIPIVHITACGGDSNAVCQNHAWAPGDFGAYYLLRWKLPTSRNLALNNVHARYVDKAVWKYIAEGKTFAEACNRANADFKATTWSPLYPMDVFAEELPILDALEGANVPISRIDNKKADSLARLFAHWYYPFLVPTVE